MHLIPQSWSHLHILVSVFPSFGLLIVLGFYITGSAADNDGIKQDLPLPVWRVGPAVGADLSSAAPVPWRCCPTTPGISRPMMNTHYAWGMAALVALIVTGVVAWVELAASPAAPVRRASCHSV